MRCSYSCGVDHHSDFLQEQIFGCQTSWFSRQGAVQEPDSAEYNPSAREREKWGFCWVYGMWTRESTKDENKSLKFAEASQCWWHSGCGLEDSLSGLLSPSVMGLLHMQQLALKIA